MQKKKIALGVSSSISLYKACEIIRLFQKNDVTVQVIMTANAAKLISPQLFSSLSGFPALVDLFALPQRERIEHISLAKEVSLLLVAPATANVIGKMAAGIADDFLTTFYLAVRSPVVVAPAMNEAMYFHPQVQENCRRLKERGVIFVEPGRGKLACGDEGWGKLASPEKIVSECLTIINQADSLKGVKVLITAGPTREYLDTVRFISNPSSGKMGFALAEEAAHRGATVFLVSGPTSLLPPARVKLIPVESTREMAREVEKIFPEVEVVVAAAAVVDYEFSRKYDHKLKKEKGSLQLELKPTIDILAELGKKKANKILVGFAAESEDIVANARKKLKKKNLDLLVANDIRRQDIGFTSDFNEIMLIYPDGRLEEIGKATKREISRIIWERIEKIIEKRKAAPSA
jgi:phosphopantothenoylcysteine decarboxylase/phosphopantothenate--cysteine ligase